MFYSAASDGERRRGSSIGYLDDSTIDELFPPSDQDLAEMMMVEQYTEVRTNQSPGFSSPSRSPFSRPSRRCWPSWKAWRNRTRGPRRAF